MADRLEVLVLDVELRLPAVDNRKAKRAIVQSLVRTLDNWTSVGVAEVGHHDLWQRTRLGVSIVGNDVTRLEQVADAVERHVWSAAGVEVLSVERTWTELDAD